MPTYPMSVASAFDGYPMALKGHGSRALAGSALSAFIAGTACIVLFTFFARPLAEYALTWGPPEYFSVMLLAYAALAGLEGGSLVKSSISVLIGLILTGVGGNTTPMPVGRWAGQWGLSGPWQQALGPMQFLPGTFAAWAVDLFADRDLKRIAPTSRCPADGYPEALPELCDAFPPGPVLYAGGLENHPPLVREAVDQSPI